MDRRATCSDIGFSVNVSSMNMADFRPELPGGLSSFASMHTSLYQQAESYHFTLKVFELHGSWISADLMKPKMIVICQLCDMLKQV
jgi:hypothetical protein